MFKSHGPFRFTTVRLAIITIIGASALMLNAAGTSASGLSLVDSVKEFFGLQGSLSGRANPGDVKDAPTATFAPGNLVVVQIGDGVATLGGASAQVALVEYGTTPGTPVQTIPVASTGGSPRLTVTGSSTSEGHLVRSSDGNYLTFTGYDVIAGTPTGFAVNGTPRVIGRVNGFGTVDLTTAFTDGGTGAVRSVASTNGIDMWMTNSAVGLRYGTFGANAVSTQVSTTPVNTRVVKVFNGQLYMTSGSGGFTCTTSVGTGTPTTTGNTTAVFPGMTCTGRSPYSFSISPAGTTMYVADDGSAVNNGGIQKWTFSAGTWTNAYTLLNAGATTTGTRGLTVDWSGSDPIIYATTAAASANLLIKVTDTGAASTSTTLATAAANTVFRGVDFTPASGGPTPTATSTATASPTPTNTATATNTPTPTNTATPAGTPTNTATPTPTQTPVQGPTFVISQVYGGGGADAGTPTYTNDYVEIKNVTGSVQTLNLLKLYYGSATGNFASSGGNAFDLPNVSLNPGQFYLVQLGTTGTAGSPLPVTPDATTTGLNMAAGSGKVALVTGGLAINECGSTATPCSALQLSFIVDWVAYGAAGNGTAGNGEGGTSVNNGVAITNTDGGVRKVGGCQDTNNNNADFDVVSGPVPRNSSTTAPCGPPPSPTPTCVTMTTLLGSNEVPANASPGTGTGIASLSADEATITADLSWTGLTSSANAAHIHGPAAVGSNAPVLFGFTGVPASSTGSIPTQSFAITPTQVAQFKAGMFYFNVHSSTFPGGEIRGQLFPPCAATPTPTPTNTATSTPTNTPTSTPTATPGGASIAGTILYGNAIPAATRPISNATVASTAGSPAVSTVTAPPGGTAGQYFLTGFGAGAYTIAPTKSTGQNNVTSFDAARVAQHAAGINLLTGNQLVVADVSANNTISSFDAGQIAKYVVSDPPFGQTGTWRFYTIPSVPFPPGATATSRTYASVTTAITGQDYTGLLMGEVSGNWNNTGARPAVGPERTSAVAAPRLVTPADGDVLIPVNVQGAVNKGIISYEFNLRYDPSVIQPLSQPVDLAGTVSSKLSVVTNADEAGLLKVAVYGAMPISGNGLLMNLRFTAVGAPGSVSPLTWEKMMFNEGDPQTTVADGQVELSAAAPNQAEVSGRLLTTMGQGVSNARVTLTDTTGQTRSILSNGFGVYRFGNLQVGQTYTISVGSRHYAFTPMTVSVVDQAASVDVIAAQ